MTYRVDFSQPQVGTLGDARITKYFGRTVNLLASDLITGNQVAAFRVPSGFVIVGLIANFLTALDTNGTPTLTISVGDVLSSTRYLNASTTGRAGGLVTTLASTGFLFANSSHTDVLVTATAGAATAVAGQLQLYLSAFSQNP